MTLSKPLESETWDDGSEAGINLCEQIPPVVSKLAASWKADVRFSNRESETIPSHESIIEIIHQTRRILFPGYFNKARLDNVNLEYTLGRETTDLFENLSREIASSIQHDRAPQEWTAPRLTESGRETSLRFIQALPGIRDLLIADIQAAFDGDPAAKSFDEIIFSYPGLLAITVYRLAHKLHELAVPLIPRIMTEYAHSLTGIDIHPGAKIGRTFFIDHGTGVVVGETAEIGNRVRIYQGVTLGALSIPKENVHHYRNKKRHPTIEDDVIIYANTTILGGETVIGARSVIGGNIWITESVPPDTKVLLKRPELVYIGNHKDTGNREERGRQE